MVNPAAGLTAIKTVPTIELILIVGMVLYIDNEFYVIQILESFYVEIIIFPVIFDGQTPMLFVARGYNLCILGESDAGKSYLAKAIGIKACNRYNVGYFHSEELLESMVALKEQD